MTKILNQYDFIVKELEIVNEINKPEKDYTVYKMYDYFHIIQDLDYTLLGVKELFPDLFPIIEHEIKTSPTMYMCNMFITKKKFFDEYCNFLFPILFYVAKNINLMDDKHFNKEQVRVFGALGERLFRPWLIATNHTAIKGNLLALNDKDGKPIDIKLYTN